MTYVTLWSPGATGAEADSPADGLARRSRERGNPSALPSLLTRLLALSPHAAAERWGAGTLAWVDGRGLPARPLARAVLAAGRAHAAAHAAGQGARVGVARVPVAAAVAARWGAARESVGSSPDDAAPVLWSDAGAPAPAPAAPCTAVAPGAEAHFLAAHPLRVLLREGAPRDLARAADGLSAAGVGTCGALAALAAVAVEVRFGGAGAALRALARAEDRRVVFAHAARELPSASAAWTEYELREPGPLMFTVAKLVERVCDALHARGEAARGLVLTLALAGGGALERRVRGARDAADPEAWRRLVRAELERVGQRGGGLADGVTGVALAVEAARRARAPQADLFDRGGASALAAERAAARLVEDGAGRVVRPAAFGHALPEARLMREAVEVEAALARAVGDLWGATARGEAARGAGEATRPLTLVVGGGSPDANDVSDAAPRLTLVRPEALPHAAASAPPDPRADGLRLRLLPAPRLLAVTTRPARGHRVPVRYRTHPAEGARAPVEVLEAGGPDRIVAGLATGTPAAREYWHCFTDQGALVLLYRDLDTPDGGWYLHGWWD